MKTAQLTITIRYRGSCKEADMRWALEEACQHLADNGKLSPDNDCEVKEWSSVVTFGKSALSYAAVSLKGCLKWLEPMLADEPEDFDCGNLRREIRRARTALATLRQSAPEGRK